MEDRIIISVLLDFYGELLTSKQKNIMTLYYNEDLSLSEISEHTKTTRQAIYDIIKRCNKLLFNYESKLKLMSKNKKLKEIKSELIDYIFSLEEKIKKEDFKDTFNLLNNMKRKIIENL
ncbi:putative DNA-binding protein [Clostridium acetireducens DSM 10703]|uniref:UPF0122 protein CLOACE_00490 n=1 Tax=Clostridium acetireducens DSM 10703 TaxID=1121290 RepID=A0A1E8F2D1_9CLOT|nr:putative DNA-binding protein [Clostridium acetireducens]OFI07701.1 putative DNA-binding protein [Clostridium acetireducens DSM 10703]